LLRLIILTRSPAPSDQFFFVLMFMLCRLAPARPIVFNTFRLLYLYCNMPIYTPGYQTQSAILFIFFNRIDTTLRVLEQIALARPSRLYLNCDGPRPGREEEAEKCMQARKAVVDFINWECEVHTLFREENVGPKEAISAAIDWFFEHEEEGIILEHDCMPAPTFFYYCDHLLEQYRNDSRICLISGCNLKTGTKWGNGSYYFSNLTNGWGWATWKRSWKYYDKDLKQFEADQVRAPLQKIFEHPLIVDRWVEIFRETKEGKINTWDYQLSFSHLFNHSLTIVPNYNLVSNIGFDEYAENTTNPDSPFANIPLEDITEIIHPTFMVPEKEADNQILFQEFQIHEKVAHLKKHNSGKRRFKRWLKNIFK
jgi:hypothetical protein